MLLANRLGAVIIESVKRSTLNDAAVFAATRRRSLTVFTEPLELAGGGTPLLCADALDRPVAVGEERRTLAA
jgi:hypothetical protein